MGHLEQIDNRGTEAAQPLVSMILPAYNEATRRVTDPRFGLAASLNDGHKALYREFGRDYELVVVNDGSSDQTTNWAYSNGATRVISYPTNQGRGYALRTAMEQTNGSVKAWVDSDNSYSWDDDVLSVLSPVINKKSDIAIAARCNSLGSHQNLLRAVGHYGVFALTELIAKTPSGITDTQGGLQAYSSLAADTIWPLTKTNRWGTNREALVLARQHDFKVEAVTTSPSPVPDSRVRIIKSSIEIVKEAMLTRRLHPEQV
jgi:dolichyl-phosphate beta-glucosyltransferase